MSLGMVSTAQAQRRTYRLGDRQVDSLITRIEQNTDRFRASVDAGLDRSRYDGTRAEDNVNNFIRDFEAATDQLRERFNGRRSVAADVENVLAKAAFINDFMARTRLTTRAQNDWALVRTDLSALASAYNVVWAWDRQQSTYPTPGTYPTTGGDQRAYRLGDREVDTIIRRVEQNTDRFRASIDAALDRSRYDNTRAENNINEFVRNFETSTDRLRSRFNSRQSVDEDVLGVLNAGASIDTFMRNNRLTNRVQTDWSTVRTDLTALADAYAVAWNWNNYPNNNPTYPTNTYPGTGVGVGTNRLTGTYRLDPSRSSNPRDEAERATSSLPAGDRQRVYDRVLARLEAPEQIAIDRRGRTVQIASTRAPQATFEADGTEREEPLPNGRTSRVRANLVGDRLEVRSTGFRESDFTVMFDPIDRGRGLQVTRSFYSERLTQPVQVVDYYTKVSDVAQFDIYNGSGGNYPSGTSSTLPTGEFLFRDGETVVATLESELSTRTVQPGQRITLVVRQPSQYEGAVIEGAVASSGRGGRVTGRSEMSFDFDTIRLRDGRSYRFAGFVESVRTANGEVVKVDNEGTVRDNDQTNKTVQRTAIGTAVGAIIGAIAGGGKGAAIGAIVGAAGGAGSVYVQGRDELDLPLGTEFTLRSSAPRNR
ncbi:MAG TPA: YMGG-like glycine zipper-containing protein [Pyrinomonadaceae bacterium]